MLTVDDPCDGVRTRDDPSLGQPAVDLGDADPEQVVEGPVVDLGLALYAEEEVFGAHVVVTQCQGCSQRLFQALLALEAEGHLIDFLGGRLARVEGQRHVGAGSARLLRLEPLRWLQSVIPDLLVRRRASLRARRCTTRDAVQRHGVARGLPDNEPGNLNGDSDGPCQIDREGAGLRVRYDGCDPDGGDVALRSGEDQAR